MSINYLKDISVKPFIDKGIASIMPKEECFKFNEFISNHYPWIEVSQTLIDWDKVQKNERMNWGKEDTDEHIHKFIDNSFMSKYEEVCYVYSSCNPGVIVPYNVGRDEFSTLICPGHAQSLCFIVGVGRDSYNIPSLIVEDFIEVTLFTEWISYPLERGKLVRH